MALDMKPYVGIGQVLLGMSPNEVASILGPPQRFRNMENVIREIREQSAPMCFYRNGKLSELSASPSCKDIELQNFKIFQHADTEVLKFIQNLSDVLYERLGFVISIALGMTLTGFHDGDDSQKAITVFEKGLWDDSIADAKVIDFKQM